MINIDYTSSKAIYEQIYDEMVRLILSGALRPDEQLPSVRELAALIKVNPNTIQKTYKILETNNYIYTIKGKGNFVKSTEELKSLHTIKIIEKLYEVITALKELGLTDNEILVYVHDAIDKAINNKTK